MKIFTGCSPALISRKDAELAVTFDDKEGKRLSVNAAKLFVTVGKAPNTQGLGLEKAGVKYNRKSVIVDRALRTSARHIYACGDIAGPYRFSHMAEYQAVTAAINALFPFKRKADYRIVPRCIFTDPDLARAGLTEEEAAAAYKGIKVYRSFYGDQAIFVTRDVFDRIGGFDEVELFEDVMFSKKMKKAAKTCILNAEVHSSARRWKKQGICRTTLINWLVSGGFFLGVSSRYLKKAYSDIR